MASSTRRRFVMMISVPGNVRVKVLQPNVFGVTMNGQPLGRIVAATKRGRLFILAAQRVTRAPVHDAFRRWFQIRSSIWFHVVPCGVSWADQAHTSVAGLGVRGPFGPRTGSSSGPCRAVRRAAAVRRARAPAAALRAADCRAEFPAAVPWACPVSQAGFPAARSASTMRPCDCRCRGHCHWPCVTPLLRERQRCQRS